MAWMRTISAGPGSIWKGSCRRRRQARRLVREVEALEEEDEMELEGPVEGGGSGVMSPRMGSLSPFEGRWLELECKFDGMRLSQCREDD